MLNLQAEMGSLSRLQQLTDEEVNALAVDFPQENTGTIYHVLKQVRCLKMFQ